MNENKEEKKKTMNIAHSPAITEYTKTHSKDPLNYSLKIASSRAIFCLVQVVVLYLLGQNISHIASFVGKLGNFAMKPLYYFLQFLMLFSLQNLIYYSLNLFSVVYKLHYPDLIFVTNLLKYFSSDFSIIFSWSLSAFAISFKDFSRIIRAKSQQGSFPSEAFTYFTFVSGDSSESTFSVESFKNGIRSSMIFHMIIPCILKMFVVFVLRDFVTFVLNYLIHYKYYEKRILENTEKITLLRTINDTAKVAYNIDLEETSKIVFQTFSSDGIQNIKLSDLNKFFEEATANKIFELCNGNEHDEVSQDEIYMFYVSSLTEQALLEKSICSNSSTVKSFKSVLDVCVFMLCAVIFLNYFPIIDTYNVDSFKNPIFFMAALLSMNFSFGDSYRSFFNSLNFIFFIRPYEIGDYILLNDRHYEVSEINLLTTILYDGSNFYVFPNSTICSCSIKNMRLNRVWKETFNFKFSFSDFNSKKDELLKKLGAIMKQKTTEYKKKPYYDRLTLIGSDMIEVAMVVQINTSATSFEQIRERQNSLVFKIKNILQELDLKQV